MGFKNGAYATVWETKNVSPTVTEVRLSTSFKPKDSDKYEQDFSGFVRFVGSANAQNALRLKNKDRIKLGNTEVTTRYNKDKNITYTNFTCFGFEMADSSGGSAAPTRAQNSNVADSYEGGNDVDETGHDLPF